MKSWHWCPKSNILIFSGMDYIDLTKKTIKIVGIHFSYDKKLEDEENFINHVRKIEKVLKLC